MPVDTRTDSASDVPPTHRVPELGLLPSRLLVVSNRLPYEITTDERGHARLERGMGGLVTAVDPVMRLSGGTWFGWSGSHSPLPVSVSVEERMAENVTYDLHPLQLTEAEVQRYYLGYANRGIWPLFHYFQEHCRFDDTEWRTYRDVNRRFAREVVKEYRRGDVIWIHDYHLLLAPRMIRRELPDAPIGLFLHIPFPSPEILRIDIHSRELLEGMLGADLVGFHTRGYARNFLRAVGDMTDRHGPYEDMRVRHDRRWVRAGVFPISIDTAHFEEMAGREGIDDKIREIRGGYRAHMLALGVDRLDYTKGILERLRAIEIMLDRHPEMQGNFTFIQFSAPSRTKLEAYRMMREEIERMVGHVNGRFGGKGCIPIDYRYEGRPQEELVAYYRAADVALVTPLRDGMNLVAKEYVASRLDDDGALVLSHFAGAAQELNDSILVNPYHPQVTADGIHRAVTMPTEERRRAMQAMRRVVRRNDIYWWLERFLHELRDAVRDREQGGA